MDTEERRIIWCYLDEVGVKYDGWTSVPFCCKAALFQAILSAPDWDEPYEGQDDDDDDQSNYFMWSKWWDLEAAESLRLMAALFNGLQEVGMLKLFVCYLVIQKSTLQIVTTLHCKLRLWRVVCALLCPYNCTALHAAAYNGHLGIVEILLRNSRVDPSILDNFILYAASLGNQLEVVKLLLSSHSNC
ncbi:hypothetical protein BDR26DRAFT_937168 [Obelidium mucronatum]|nr:hypothetical protein BDR26DRAFT_937168 [Obelidium mucronatum]